MPEVRGSVSTGLPLCKAPCCDVVLLRRTRPPILQINTWDELISAVQAGSLTETQWVECKKGVPATSPEANAELAKDLASLTVDGGVLVIGVKDKASSAEGVVGTDDDIEGLKVRITGIASGTRVMPPMQVIIGDPIPNPDKDDCYAVLVSGTEVAVGAAHGRRAVLGSQRGR